MLPLVPVENHAKIANVGSGVSDGLRVPGEVHKKSGELGDAVRGTYVGHRLPQRGMEVKLRVPAAPPCPIAWCRYECTHIAYSRPIGAIDGSYVLDLLKLIAFYVACRPVLSKKACDAVLDCNRNPRVPWEARGAVQKEQALSKNVEPFGPRPNKL